MKTAYRTHTCGELRAAHAGETVSLTGWVHRRRDQGGLVFLDLRDRYGLTQIQVSKDEQPDAHAAASGVRSEFVLKVDGLVRERPEGARNDALATGDIEVSVTAVTVLSESPTPPFEISGTDDVSDEVRFRYRYLDMRRPEVQKKLLLRHRMNMAVRDFFESQGFVEIETPVLAKATPEGARDYLVPSRLHHGKFYALPQAPQIYKQILMCAGFDRYYQLARCFRDEDLRADRQPEFTQLDLEMSFVEQEDVLQLIERLIQRLVRDIAVHPAELELPLRRIPYSEAMLRYGSDKPDLRFGLEIEDISDLAAKTEFKVFTGAIDAGGCVRGIKVPGAAQWSRKEIEACQPVAAIHGAKGVAWAKVTDDGLSGPVAKFFTDTALQERFATETGDLLLFVADASESVVAHSLGAVRLDAAKRRDLIQKNTFAACIVVDFPLMLPGDNEGEWVAAHHPFTSPHEEDMDLLETDPGKVRALAYDPVLNGVELGSGSIRIHRPDVQERVLKALGLPMEVIKDRFSFLLDALQYGAPPHGGIALGLDRIAMLLSGDDTIREVIAFPKTTSAVDLMSDSPSPVDTEQLDELGIATKE
ncbi:MAG: aspartate--tRNA ligase [Planctomycetota bacterium]